MQIKYDALADSNQQNYDQDTPLGRAIIDGNPTITAACLQQNPTAIKESVELTDTNLNLNAAVQLVTDIISRRNVNPSNTGFLTKIFTKRVPSKWENYIKIVEILLHAIATRANKIGSDMFIDGNNPFHKLIENTDLETFQLLYNSASQYIKELRYLKNYDGLTPLGLAIKKYGETNPDSTTQGQLQQIITKLWDQPSRFWSNATTNGNNELHTTVELYSKNELRKNKFLEMLCKKLSSIYADLGRIKNLVNGLNNSRETPLHIAIRLKLLPMFIILHPLTNLTIRNNDGLTPFDLAIKMYCEEPLDPAAQWDVEKLEEMIKILYNAHMLDVSNSDKLDWNWIINFYENTYKNLPKDKKDFLKEAMPLDTIIVLNPESTEKRIN